MIKLMFGYMKSESRNNKHKLIVDL